METPVLLTHAIEDSTDIFGISGGGGFNTPNPPRYATVVHTIKRKKANWICHILRGNCLLKHVIEGKIEGIIEVTGRRSRRCEQKLGDLKGKRRYCILKEKAIDRTVWRTGFGRGCGHTVGLG